MACEWNVLAYYSGMSLRLPELYDVCVWVGYVCVRVGLPCALHAVTR